MGYNPEAGIYGDCYRTCIAILLGMDALDVPHFVQDSILAGHHNEGEHTRIAVLAWLKSRGLTMTVNTFAANQGYTTECIKLATGGLPFLLTVQSPRYDCCHCVVAKVGEYGLEVLWCPTVGGPVTPKPYYCKDNGFDVYNVETIFAIPESLK
jgi:hypothetical protein